MLGMCIDHTSMTSVGLRVHSSWHSLVLSVALNTIDHGAPLGNLRGIALEALHYGILLLPGHIPVSVGREKFNGGP